MATFDDVRAEAASLPGTEESTSFGTPAVKVRKKLLCRLRPTPGEPGDILGLRVFFTTPHYDGYPMVLVRLRRSTGLPCGSSCGRLGGSSLRPRCSDSSATEGRWKDR